MLTRADIHNFLKSIGITSADTVLVHTSMRAIGEVDGGCDGLIDAFTSYLSDGLFIVPTHSWANVGASAPVYDVRKTASCIGALPNVAAFRADGVRSLHPTHSVAAFGKRAKEFVKGEENSGSPCPVGGVWSRLYDEDAKILLLGVGLDRNTYVHAVDELLDIPGRLADEISLTVIDYEGTSHALRFKKHGKTGSDNYENLRKPFEALGAMTNSKLGNAKIGIVSARRATEVLKLLWSRADYDFCAERKDIPEKYYL